MPAQAGVTQPIAPRPAETAASPVRQAGYARPYPGQPGARDEGPGGARRRGEADRPRGAREPWSLLWRGSLRGGLAVCVILGSAVLGAIATVVTRAQPGLALGSFVLVGTVAAALAVEPRAGRVIFPVPALAYLAAALGAGVAVNRTADSSKTGLAIGAAQWFASGFFVMALATVLAVALTAIRWFLWRHDQPAAGGRPGGRGATRGNRGDGWANRGDTWGTQGTGGGTQGNGRQGDPRLPRTQPGTMPAARPPGQRPQGANGTRGTQGTRGAPGAQGTGGPDQRPAARPEQAPGRRPGPQPGSGLAPYTQPGSGLAPYTQPGSGLTPYTKPGSGIAPYTQPGSGPYTQPGSGPYALGPDRALQPAGNRRCSLAGNRACSLAGNRALQLLQRGVAQHQVLDPVVRPEVDLGLGLVAVTVGGHHGAEPELVVGDQVSR